MFQAALKFPVLGKMQNQNKLNSGKRTVLLAPFPWAIVSMEWTSASFQENLALKKDGRKKLVHFLCSPVGHAALLNTALTHVQPCENDIFSSWESIPGETSSMVGHRLIANGSKTEQTNIWEQQSLPYSSRDDIPLGCHHFKCWNWRWMRHHI